MPGTLAPNKTPSSDSLNIQHPLLALGGKAKIKRHINKKKIFQHYQSKWYESNNIIRPKRKKNNYVAPFQEIPNSEGFINCITGSKVTPM